MIRSRRLLSRAIVEPPEPLSEYANINGVLLKRTNEVVDTKELFTWNEAMAQFPLMPTIQEWDRILPRAERVTWDNELKGCWVGRDHNLMRETDFSTFLPALGYKTSLFAEVQEFGIRGYYWSSTDRTTSLALYGGFYNGVVVEGEAPKTRFIAVRSKVLPPSLLPVGYTQVDYLQSNGNQIINTEFVSASGRHDVECRFATVNASTQGFSLFGARTNSGMTPVPARFGNLYFGTTNRPGVWIGSSGEVSTLITPSTMTLSPGVIHTIKLFVDDSTNTVRRVLTNEATSAVADNTGTYSGVTRTLDPVGLFGAINTGSMVERITARVYGFKIWEAGILARDFIPALDLSNRPCMYCLVTKMAYYDVWPSGGDFFNG